MAGDAVQTVQLEVLVKVRLLYKTTLLPRPHARQDGHLHVIPNQCQNALGVSVREAQAGTNPLGKLDTLLNVAMEAYPVGPAEGQRLADVVQQHTPGESW